MATMITMSHPDIAGLATASEDAFTDVWEPLGWELVDPDTIGSRLPAPMHWAGDWNSSRNYEPGDGVEVGGVTYIALQTNRNKAPASEPTFWEAISGAGGGVLSVDGQTGAVDLSDTYAPTASPTFTGTPVAPKLKLAAIDPSGATFGFQQATGTFEDGLYSDSTMNWGYNVSATPGVKQVATEPILFWQMETKFRNNSGTPYGSELHLNYGKPGDGAAPALTRPINLFLEHVSGLIELAFVADSFNVATSAGSQTLQYGSSTWFFNRNVQVSRGASAPSLLTIGDALNDASLVFDAKAAGGVNSMEWKRGGASKWLVYDAASDVLYFRNSQHGRMHMYFIPGASAAASYTDIESNVRCYGPVNEFGAATNQIGLGSFGTADAWVDARGSNANIGLNLRSKGTGPIVSMSDHRHDGKVGFYATAPIAKQTGVAVDAAGIHAALVNLGLIAA